MPDKNRNFGRIKQAERALTTLDCRDDLEADIVDTMTNLLHLAHANGLDTPAILRMANIHFIEEEKGNGKI